MFSMKTKKKVVNEYFVDPTLHTFNNEIYFEIFLL
jgi:hypothetical protein